MNRKHGTVHTYCVFLKPFWIKIIFVPVLIVHTMQKKHKVLTERQNINLRANKGISLLKSPLVAALYHLTLQTSE